jgi:hypothetical protein
MPSRKIWKHLAILRQELTRPQPEAALSGPPYSPAPATTATNACTRSSLSHWPSSYPASTLLPHSSMHGGLGGDRTLTLHSDPLRLQPVASVAFLYIPQMEARGDRAAALQRVSAGAVGGGPPALLPRMPGRLALESWARD